MQRTWRSPYGCLRFSNNLSSKGTESRGRTEAVRVIIKTAIYCSRHREGRNKKWNVPCERITGPAYVPTCTKRLSPPSVVAHPSGCDHFLFLPSLYQVQSRSLPDIITRTASVLPLLPCLRPFVNLTYCLSSFNSFITTRSIVTKQAAPPMKLEIGSARKTPFTPR